MYREEYPRPQFCRAKWENLNGEWDFYIDTGRSGRERKLYLPENYVFDKKINVPFCPESKLSGIENVDFMDAVWYRREAVIEKRAGERVKLNIGAADYETFVYVNGKLAGTHKGGYVSFGIDITDFAVDGENEIVVCCEDLARNNTQPCGKQSREYYSHGCDYTRTTGIWQTVWLEYLPEEHIKTFRFYPDPDSCAVDAEIELSRPGKVAAAVTYGGREVGSASVDSTSCCARLHIALSEKHLWEIGRGELYDVVLTFCGDRVGSYFGLRNVTVDGYKFRINGKSVFQRLVLDQGFYPDGVYTAPSDAELEGDILRSLACGFNGARLHQKVFEERFLYHADRLGYIVWGEYPNWGLDHTVPQGIFGVLPEWLEEIDRDFNHPSIIGWCPFNETWDRDGRRQIDDILRDVYLATKAADRTRPCIDTSGNYHVVTDIYDVHNYDQDPAVFASFYADLAEKNEFKEHVDRQRYDGKKPVFISEYGGIRKPEDGREGWGYGNAPKTDDEFFSRLKGLTDAMLGNERICAYCYTQLTDIEQEQNGVYYYDRTPKYDPDRFKAIFGAGKAAIED